MEYFDTAEPGFGLRVSGTLEKAIKTWIFLSRVKGELPSPGGKRPPLRRLTIGAYPAYGWRSTGQGARSAQAGRSRDRSGRPAQGRSGGSTAPSAREVRTIASVVDEFMRRYMEHGKRPHSTRYIEHRGDEAQFRQPCTRLLGAAGYQTIPVATSSGSWTPSRTTASQLPPTGCERRCRNCSTGASSAALSKPIRFRLPSGRGKKHGVNAPSPRMRSGPSGRLAMS